MTTLKAVILVIISLSIFAKPPHQRHRQGPRKVEKKIKAYSTTIKLIGEIENVKLKSVTSVHNASYTPLLLPLKCNSLTVYGDLYPKHWRTNSQKGNNKLLKVDNKNFEIKVENYVGTCKKELEYLFIHIERTKNNGKVEKIEITIKPKKSSKPNLTDVIRDIEYIQTRTTTWEGKEYLRRDMILDGENNKWYPIKQNLTGGQITLDLRFRY